MSEWLEWTDVEKYPDYKGCGVYKIRLVGSKGLPLKFPRFLADDKNGILYIGHTENIKKRIRFFCGAIQGKQYNNTEGQRLNLLMKSAHFIQSYSNFRIQYSFKRSIRRREAKLEKERLLECYFERYGEAPPVNNNKSLFDILLRRDINIAPVSEDRLPIQVLEKEDSSMYISGELGHFRERSP